MLKRILIKSIYTVGKLLGLETPQSVVLCYHSIGDNSEFLTVSIKNFIEQVKVIQQHATFVSIDELISKNSSKNRVAITFDDGYADFKNILPFLEQQKIPFTLFVVSDPENSNRTQIKNTLPLLSLKEIAKIQQSKMATIGCHSSTHANLTLLQSHELVKETTQAKKYLEKILGKSIKYFCYPNGAYNTHVMNAVKTAGYRAAFTVEPGNGTTHLFEIPRIVINRTHSFSEFPAVFSRSVQGIRKLIAL